MKKKFIEMWHPKAGLVQYNKTYKTHNNVKIQWLKLK